jgi:hypothetical protein
MKLTTAIARNNTKDSNTNPTTNTLKNSQKEVSSTSDFE